MPIYKYSYSWFGIRKTYARIDANTYSFLIKEFSPNYEPVKIKNFSKYKLCDYVWIQY